MNITQSHSANHPLSPSHKPLHPRPWWEWIVLLVTLLGAFALRTIDLHVLPFGLHYDEAANVILSQEIASGSYLPIFIKPYTGKEVLYFYLVALMMKLGGPGLYTTRLTSAFIGTFTVALAYALARQIWHHREHEARGIALIAAALQATTFWHIMVSRLGFRAIVQPPLEALTFIFLYRALRTDSRRDWALAGLFTSLAAYTYLAVRAFPVVIAFFLLWAILSKRRPWRAWASALATYFGTALLTFAPLGIFFLRNPDYFGYRISQVSFLNPEVSHGDPWGALRHAFLAAWGMFGFYGDPNWRFNVAGTPVYGPVIATAFYLGLIVALTRMVRRKDVMERGTYALLWLWLFMMLLPSIMGMKEIPHSLRPIGIIPIMVYFPALTFSELIGLLGRLLKTKRETFQFYTYLLIAALLFLGNGARTAYLFFEKWPNSPETFLANYTDLTEAAKYINDHDDEAEIIYIAAEDYHHPTLALLAESYARLKWFVKGHALAFPYEANGDILYVFTYYGLPDDAIRRFLPADKLVYSLDDPRGIPAIRVYRFSSADLPTIQPQYPLEANLGDQLQLLGYDLNATPVSGGTLDLTIYWKVLRDSDRDDYAFFHQLIDEIGLRWGQLDTFDYPSAQWEKGEILILHRQIPIWDGAPPGNYTLEVGVRYGENARLLRLDEQRRVIGTTIPLGPFTIGPADHPPFPLPPIPHPREGQWSPLTQRGYERDRGDLRPGEGFVLGLYWQANTAPQTDYQTRLSLVSSEGTAYPLWEGHPAHGTYPTSQWAEGTFVRDRYAIKTPVDLPAGDYTLRLELIGPDGPLPTTTGETSVDLGVFHIHATQRNFTVPPMEYPLGLRLGDKIELLGYDIDRTTIAPGESIHLTLYWRALQTTERSYTVFTHLLDPTMQIQAQQDNPPVQGTYPTTMWAEGEVIQDTYTLTLNPDAPAGTYILEVGMYLPETGERLLLYDAAGTPLGDHAILVPIEVATP